MKNKDHYIEEYINYRYGDIEEDDRPIYAPDIHQSKADFKAGYDLAEELFKPKWISVEEQTPNFNVPILLKYIKGKQGDVITQGYYQDKAKSIADRQLKSSQESGKFSTNGAETDEFWRKCGYGLTFFDYSGRQIQNLVAKGSENKVIGWMEIP